MSDYFEHHRRVSSWLKSVALPRDYAFADSYSVLTDPQGYMLPAYSDDGVHPSATGYEKMIPVLDAGLGRLLRDVDACHYRDFMNSAVFPRPAK